MPRANISWYLEFLFIYYIHTQVWRESPSYTHTHTHSRQCCFCKGVWICPQQQKYQYYLPWIYYTKTFFIKYHWKLYKRQILKAHFIWIEKPKDNKRFLHLTHVMDSSAALMKTYFIYTCPQPLKIILKVK